MCQQGVCLFFNRPRAGAGLARFGFSWRAALSNIFVGLLFLILPLRVWAEDISLQTRLEKALERARSVPNIEIIYDDLFWMKGKTISAAESNEFTRTMKTTYPFSQDFTRTMRVTYRADGKSFRSECRNIFSSSSNVIQLQESAFNGKLYSEFQAGSSWMVQQDGSPPEKDINPPSPLVFPFLFLSRRSDNCPEGGLRFTDLETLDILNGLVLPGGIESNGIVHASFPGLPLNGTNQAWSISIDNNTSDFRPTGIIEIVYSEQQTNFVYEKKYTLSNYTNVGGYYFPTKIASSMYEFSTNRPAGPMLVGTGLVTMISVRLPGKLPEALFQLDETKALHVWNTGEDKGYGVGLLLGESGSGVVVKRIVANSPAGRQSEMGVGDRILSIAQGHARPSPVQAGKAGLARAVALLRGPKESTVRLTFVSSGKEETNSIELARGMVRERLSGGQMLQKGMNAPEMEMIVLTNRAPELLSSFAGKIVILKVWATWCSPCQQSMADFQMEGARHPGWKNKVAFISASVDDTADIAFKRIQARGWNNTHNVWLTAKDIQSYHLGALPTSYVIDAGGKIAAAEIGNDGASNIISAVDQLLERP